MKHFPLFFLSLLLFPFFSSAQFSIRYDSIVSLSTSTGGFVKSSDGNCTIFAFPGDSTGYFLRTDSAGQLLVSKRLHYPNFGSARRLVETSDTNFLTLCHVPAAGNIIQYAKFDVNGNLAWTKCLSSFSYMNATPYAMCATTNGGGVIVGGGCNSSNMTTRFDSNGSPLWQYQYKDTVLAFSNAVDILAYNNDFVLLDGAYTSPNYFPAILKIDGNGLVMWCQRYHTPGTSLPSRIIKTNDGGLMMCGTYSVNNTIYNTFLVRTDSAGTIIWSKLYDCGSDNRLSDIASLPGGDFIFTSANGNNLAQTHIDSLGNVTWARRLPSNTYVNGAAVADAGNGDFYTAGGSKVPISNLVYNRIWLSKQPADSAIFCNSTPLQYTISNFPLTPQASHIQRVNLAFVPANGLLTSNPVNLSEFTLTCPPIITGIPAAGINEQQTIFPNPVTDHSPLQSTRFIEQGTVSVYNVAGELVISKVIYSTFVLLNDYSQMPDGVYFIKVNADGRQFVEKLVICR